MMKKYLLLLVVVLLISFTSAVPIIQTMTADAGWSSNSQTAKYGATFRTNSSALGNTYLIYNVTKPATSTATRAYIQSADGLTTYGNATFTSNLANFTSGAIRLNASTYYRVVLDADGAAYTRPYKASWAPVPLQYINYTGNENNGTETGQIVNMYVDIANQTSVTINSPSNLTEIISGTNQTFSINILGVNLSNTTMYINGILNETKSISGDSNTSTFNKVFSYGNYTYTFGACGNGGCDNSSTNLIIVNNYSLGTITFNQQVISNDYERISFIINYSSHLSPSAAVITYNGNNYSSTINSLGSNSYNISNNINIPNVSTQTNVTFNFTIINNDSSTILSASNNQTIRILYFDNCSSYTTVLYNFTIVDEITQVKISPSLTNAQLQLILYSSNGTIISSFNKSYNTTNSFAVCINPNITSSNYLIDSTVMYQGTGYSTEYYNIRSNTINNSIRPINITLYSLDTTNAQEFQIIFKDESFIPVSDALIVIQRNYISEGVFKTVEIPITDSAGTTLAHLQLSDIIYTFIVTKDNEILATFDNRLAYCENVATGDCIINLNALSSSSGISRFVNVDDYSFSIDYNNNTRVVTSSFVVLTGVSATNLLNVTLFDGLGNTTVCSDTLVSSSGTLTCEVPLSFENSTVVVTLQKDGEFVGKSIINLNNNPSGIFGNNRVFVSIFAILMMIGVGLSSSPVTFGIALIIGVVGISGLSLLGGNTLFGVGATITWFIIAIIIVLIKSRRTE